MTNPSSFAEYSRRLLAFMERGGVSADDEFSSLASELFALQFTRVAPYRRLCEARRVTPDSLTDWRQIPAVPTTAFKELELTSLKPAERTTVFHSSGTTQHRPSRHFHNAESLAVYEAALLPWFARHLLADGDQTTRAASPSPPSGERAGVRGQHVQQLDTRPTFLCLAPPPDQAPHSSLVHMFATVSHAFGAPDSRFAASTGEDNSWSLDSAAALTALRHAEQSGQPLVLLGTAFMFVHLLDELDRRGLSIALPPGSRVMETGGYKGRSRELSKSELHTLITSRFSVPPAFIVCEYGMSELSSQAYSQITNHCLLPFHFSPWCRALVISPETGREVADGETGLLRLFDLANVRSVMAIQTDDLAVRRGDGFELLGRAAQTEARGCSLLAA
jgi:hypothetical protein